MISFQPGMCGIAQIPDVGGEGVTVRKCIARQAIFLCQASAKIRSDRDPVQRIKGFAGCFLISGVHRRAVQKGILILWKNTTKQILQSDGALRKVGFSDHGVFQLKVSVGFVKLCHTISVFQCQMSRGEIAESACRCTVADAFRQIYGQVGAEFVQVRFSPIPPALPMIPPS